MEWALVIVEEVNVRDVLKLKKKKSSFSMCDIWAKVRAFMHLMPSILSIQLFHRILNSN